MHRSLIAPRTVPKKIHHRERRDAKKSTLYLEKELILKQGTNDDNKNKDNDNSSSNNNDNKTHN